MSNGQNLSNKLIDNIYSPVAILAVYLSILWLDVKVNANSLLDISQNLVIILVFAITSIHSFSFYKKVVANFPDTSFGYGLNCVMGLYPYVGGALVIVAPFTLDLMFLLLGFYLILLKSWHLKTIAKKKKDERNTEEFSRARNKWLIYSLFFSAVVIIFFFKYNDSTFLNIKLLNFDKKSVSAELKEIDKAGINTQSIKKLLADIDKSEVRLNSVIRTTFFASVSIVAFIYLILIVVTSVHGWKSNTNNGNGIQNNKSIP